MAEPLTRLDGAQVPRLTKGQHGNIARTEARLGITAG